MSKNTPPDSPFSASCAGVDKEEAPSESLDHNRSSSYVCKRSGSIGLLGRRGFGSVTSLLALGGLALVAGSAFALTASARENARARDREPAAERAKGWAQRKAQEAETSMAELGEEIEVLTLAGVPADVRSRRELAERWALAARGLADLEGDTPLAAELAESAAALAPENEELRAEAEYRRRQQTIVAERLRLAEQARSARAASAK